MRVGEVCSYEAYPGAARSPLGPGYRRRQPEKTVLYQLVQENLDAVLDQACERSEHGFGLPRFVEQTFADYLACGILARGFARVVCDDCKRELLLPFSCKRRGLCPSCDGRRMARTAAQLCDRVLPQVGYRQYTLSFPRRVRFALACDRRLLTGVLRVSLAELFRWQKRQAREFSAGPFFPGSVTAVQWVGGMANLNPHFHIISPDGVFVGGKEPDEPVGFVPLDAPTDQHVERLLGRIAERVEQALADRVSELEGTDQPIPGALERAQSVAVGMAERADTEVGPAHRASPPPKAKRRCAFLFGYSLHANVAVHENDRQGLERLCRYILRPAIATERLSVDEQGKVRYRYRRPDRHGKTELCLSPQAFVARLAGLVPPRYQNLVRYHGCFAPQSKLRTRIVPAMAAQEAAARAASSRRSSHASHRSSQASVTGPAAPPAPFGSSTDQQAAGSNLPAPGAATPPRGQADDRSAAIDAMLAPPLDWAALLRRVFQIDATTCHDCGGRVRVIAFLPHPDLARPILEHLGLPCDIPTPSPARSPPQLSFDQHDEAASAAVLP